MKELLRDPRIALALAQVDAALAVEAVQYARRMEQLHDAAVLSARLCGVDGVERHLELEVAGSLRVGQQSASILIHDAGRLVEVHPRTLAGLKDGRVLQGQARVVLQETRHCTEQVQAQLDLRLHQRHPDGLAALAGSRLTRLLHQLVLQIEGELEPEIAELREQSARDARTVRTRPEPDGMGSLWALLPAEQLRVFTLTFDELLRAQVTADRQAGTVRTADQRKADVFALLPGLALHALRGTSPLHADGSPVAHPEVVLNIHLPLATALGLSEHPATLDGYGPISARHARRLLPTATLRRIIVHDTTGQPAYTGHPLTLPPPTTPASTPAGEDAADAKAAPAEAGSARDATSSPAGDNDPAAHPAAPADADADAEADAGGCGHAGVAECDADDVVRGRVLQLLHTQPLHPEDLLDLPEPRHDPSDKLVAFLRIRDPQCVGPGCSMPARRSDQDHHHPWPQGPTTAGNLGPKSRRCHHAKTFSWTVTRDSDGTHHWHSPTGRTYTVPPSWDPPPTPRRRPRRPDHPQPSAPYHRWPSQTAHALDDQQQALDRHQHDRDTALSAAQTPTPTDADADPALSPAGTPAADDSDLWLTRASITTAPASTPDHDSQDHVEHRPHPVDPPF